MIIVIVTTEEDPKTGKSQQVVSHGVDTDTGKNIILPCDSPASVGAEWDSQIGEYVLR
ncbi:hypothetical protein LMG22037_06169 [Paraburkholderia phenoliruptrix]|jgi:hypothetical protein|uniref:Uncharacterized protein n=1 Tax=Paraburkholderia phenoliruptrix TaxID=252970 RepID=A0A6J5CHX9_9BURK|nr:hypothetical protein [Paraburkholderia phenoliruptrix]CAB3737669.1 hypothetical protein LMG22037_06169 [Paraburkholderia phenoliruptrix]